MDRTQAFYWREVTSAFYWHERRTRFLLPLGDHFLLVICLRLKRGLGGFTCRCNYTSCLPLKHRPITCKKSV